MNLFGMIDQSGSAMQAERMRAEVVAANMANAETTRTEAGTPYRRQSVVFAAGGADPSFLSQMGSAMPEAFSALAARAGMAGGMAGGLTGGMTEGLAGIAPGVHIAAVVEDKTPPLKRYDPSHPDADQEGYVAYPNINPLTEMVDLMGATRAYGLNSSAVQAEKSMIASALEIVK